MLRHEAELGIDLVWRCDAAECRADARILQHGEQAVPMSSAERLGSQTGRLDMGGSDHAEFSSDSSTAVDSAHAAACRNQVALEARRSELAIPRARRDCLDLGTVPDRGRLALPVTPGKCSAAGLMANGDPVCV